jgi:hypothetical protein
MSISVGWFCATTTDAMKIEIARSKERIGISLAKKPTLIFKECS